ncbi:MAG: hypothetical protein V2A54_13885 [Bacteroidota bacterium]
MKKKAYFFKSGVMMIPVLLIVLLSVSCTKEPGTGGSSSLYGKVHVHNYNGTFTAFQNEYNAQDADVYIVYGDERSYSDRVRTNPAGVYEFKYLRPGKYTVYVYSKDSTLAAPSGTIAVQQTVEITKNRQEVEVPEILIFE